MKLDLYDLHLVWEEDPPIIIPLGEPGARGWLTRYAEALNCAEWAQFRAKPEYQDTVSNVIIKLGTNRSLVYRRYTRGTINTGNIDENQEISYYVIGYEEDGVEHTVQVYTQLPPVIKIGGDK